MFVVQGQMPMSSSQFLERMGSLPSSISPASEYYFGLWESWEISLVGQVLEPRGGKRLDHSHVE